jgi:hypothetical protein
LCQVLSTLEHLFENIKDFLQKAGLSVPLVQDLVAVTDRKKKVCLCFWWKAKKKC